jgi:hypothetical protein
MMWLSESVPPGVNVPDADMAALGAQDMIYDSLLETGGRRAAFEIRCGDAPLFTAPLEPAAPEPEQMEMTL